MKFTANTCKYECAYEQNENCHYAVANVQCITNLITVVLAMKFVFVSLLALLSYLEEIQSAKLVYFSLIVSYGEFGFNSSGAIPSIDIALRYVNNKSELLPEYELRYNTVRNSKVGASFHCKLISVFHNY